MLYGNRNDRLADRFEDWWRRDNRGLPLMNVVAERDGAKWSGRKPKSVEAMYLDPEYLLSNMRERMRNWIYLADSYASLSADIGPGSLALYLGSEPRFAESTVWFEPSLNTPDDIRTRAFDPENRWWKFHLNLIRRLRAEAGNEFLINIPDLIENIDIYSAMRGPQNALFDLMDEPEKVEEAVRLIDDTYFSYYDEMRAIVRDESDVVSYTAFSILGRGRVAKIQCDFSAMISPAQYRRFVLPSLKKQAARLDHSLYHLDGPGAIRHVPAIMEIDDLDALQWTCGEGQPDGASPRWYSIYDDVVSAGKALWVQIYNGGVDRWIQSADSLVNRYGTKGFYFHFPVMRESDAEKLLTYAEKHWNCP